MVKSTEILELYLKFYRGEEISKSEIIEYFGNKSSRTIQRYIASLNLFFEQNEQTEGFKIKYNRKKNAYFMEKSTSNTFDKKQVLAILKIIISTRGLSESEINNIIKQLNSMLEEDDISIINKTIKSELYHYHEMSHEEPLLSKLWNLNKIALQGKSVKLKYYNAWNQGKTHIIRPLYITFSELYFYVVGANKNGCTLIFRLDRIHKFEEISQKIERSKSMYYQEGELKKRAYFMYGGEWKRVCFEFNGGIIESVIDRFPTAALIKKDYENNRFVVEIEVVGDGILMWLLSQGSKVKILSPLSLKEKYIEEIKRMQSYY